MVTHDASLAQRTQRVLLLSDGELINPWVAQAFHDLPHNQMLWLTHHLQPQTLPPGAFLEAEDLASIGLCLVIDGYLKILNGRPGSLSPTIALNPGDYLSSLDLQASEPHIAHLQSGSEEVTSLLVLERASFESWLDKHPGLRASIETGANRRQVEGARL